MPALPYPGYSWSLSQHMRRAVHEPALIFRLLEGAAIYGSGSDYADRVTAYVDQLGLIPPNVRDQRSQIWRDYQQVLLELGLIVSTRRTANRIIVTRAGLMLLDGLIGYREMLTTQALRYQYPNAYKLNIPTIVRQHLSERDPSAISNRVELEVERGVLIKPAVLILRVLLELAARGAAPALTTRECVQAMMPIRLNSDWPAAVDELVRLRSRAIQEEIETRSRRHAQEWFAMLGATDLFHDDGDTLRLAPGVQASPEMAENLCAYHEQPATFWYPDPAGSVDDWARSWFSTYGAPELGSQWTVPEAELTPEYLTTNYLDGVETEEGEAEGDPRNYENWTGDINLTPYSAHLRADFVAPPSTLDAEAAARMARGRARQQRSARLHDSIVSLAASKLEAAGYRVEADPLSIDLFADDGRIKSILEIKTVTRRNFFPRMRLGVGQLSEYRYRRNMQDATNAHGVLILSSGATIPPWILDYFSSDIRLGLVGLSGDDSFIAHTNGVVETVLTR